MADPVCPRLSALAADAAEAAGAAVARGGVYVAIDGPQFSTRAESRLYRQWGCDVIGMTAMPEAKLAREAELPYALVGMVTDYDCWRDGEEDDVAEIVARLEANADTARRLIVELARRLPEKRAPSPIDTNLDQAIITAPEARDPALVAKLDAILQAPAGVNPLPPYARFLGIRTERSEAGELLFVMPFGDVVLGRPGYLHGGAIAGLLEFAAFGALYEALGGARRREGQADQRHRPISCAAASQHDTFARGHGHPARQPGRQCRGPCLAVGPRQADRGGADERAAAARS